MRSAILRFAFSVALLLAGAAMVARAQLFTPVVPAGFVSAGANPTIWLHCYPNPGPGIVSPCTGNGAIVTQATLSAVATWVSKWNSGASPSGPLRDGSGFGHVQVTFQGPSSGTLAITAAYIGFAQTTGTGKCSSNTVFCQWDFSATPTTLLFGGSGSVNIVGNVQKASDVVAFTFNSSLPLIVAFNTSNTSVYTTVSPTSTTTSPVGTNTGWFNVYVLSGTAQAATVQKNSGYTNAAAKIKAVVKITGSL